MAKIDLLRSLLLKRLEEKGDDKFKDADPKGWKRLKYSISSFYTYASDFTAAEAVLRELVASDETGSNYVQSLALILYFQRRFEEAETEAKKALDAIQKLLGDDSPQSLGTLRMLTLIVAQEGKFDEAEKYLEAVAKGIVKLKDGTRYAKYEPEEQKAYEKTAESVENIKKGLPGAGYEDWDGGMPKEED
jgi:tetratricopeptide (TPR) repeat protein